MRTTTQPTALLVLNTDAVKTINFLHFQTIFLKEWNKEKTSYKLIKINVIKNTYCLMFNFTKNTLEINGRSFQVKTRGEYVYRFSARTVSCQSMDGLYSHFAKASDSENVFHIITSYLLKNITQ